MYIVARKNAFGHDVFFEDIPFGLFSSWVTEKRRAMHFERREDAEKIAQQFKGRVIDAEGGSENG